MFRMYNTYSSGRTSINEGLASQAASRAESKTNSLEMEVKNLQADLSRTLMICETLWELLKEKTALTEEDLHRKLYEVDMRDGILDGNNKRKAAKCPECRHMVSARHAACIYCGTVIDKSVFSL